MMCAKHAEPKKVCCRKKITSNFHSENIHHSLHMIISLRLMAVVFKEVCWACLNVPISGIRHLCGLITTASVLRLSGVEFEVKWFEQLYPDIAEKLLTGRLNLISKHNTQHIRIACPCIVHFHMM